MAIISKALRRCRGGARLRPAPYYDRRVSAAPLDPAEPRVLFRCCPRCGAGLDAPGANPLACRACDFAYFFNPTVSAAGLLLGGDGRALFIRRGHEPGKGALALVGGFVDAGERPEDALCREVREEVGVELRDIAYLSSLPNRYPYRGVTYHVADLVYTARIVDDAAARALDGVAAVEWHDPLTLDPSSLAFASMRVALETFQRRGRT
jgi:ADP-ribose pyrophosphatase YjhB (NUDIX family)